MQTLAEAQMIPSRLVELPTSQIVRGQEQTWVNRYSRPSEQHHTIAWSQSANLPSKPQQTRQVVSPIHR